MKLSFAKSWTVILTLLALTFSVIGVTPAYAATRTVSDCTAPSGTAARLVDQITAASSGDTINFSCSGTITLTTTIYINKNLTIDGTGQTVTISGGGTVQVMDVDSASLTLNNLTIANGSVATGPTGGGGIYLRAGGTLTVTNSTFSGNSTINNGGGIFQNGGTLIITNSTFSGNSAASGGGIASGSGTTTITNSTFSGNSATGGTGGGIDIGGSTTTITNSTFSGNSATSGTGGGITQVAGTVTLRNTIVANSILSGNCDGTIVNGGNNIDDGITCGWGSISGSMSSTNPLLGTLANNGGSTQTFALLTGSPAINTGNDSECTNPPINGLDQRGITRPVGSHCDIGSYELVYKLFLPLILR